MASFISACKEVDVKMPFSDFKIEEEDTGVKFSKNDALVTGFACDLSTFADEHIGDFYLENAAAGILIDVNNNKVLFAQNPFELRAPASITKVMTAYLALKYCSLDEIVVCNGESVNIADPTATKLGVKLGDKMTMDQALNLCLLPSANDVAIAIGCHISGTEAEFAKLMTEEARSLGATSTNFTDASGLGSEEHLTTAYDLYLIFNEAIKNRDFLDIIQKHEYQTTYYNKSDKEVPVTVNSTNWYFRGKADSPDSITILGGKTGTTDEAGHCLILYAKDKYSNSYIAVILGADNKNNLYNQMTDLLLQITK